LLCAEGLRSSIASAARIECAASSCEERVK
jgi:hypothetical protein